MGMIMKGLGWAGLIIVATLVATANGVSDGAAFGIEHLHAPRERSHGDRRPQPGGKQEGRDCTAPHPCRSRLLDRFGDRTLDEVAWQRRLEWWRLHHEHRARAAE